MALHSGSRLEPINDHKLLAVIENFKIIARFKIIHGQYGSLGS
jgi:hypothetical protein